MSYLYKILKEHLIIIFEHSYFMQVKALFIRNSLKHVI